jgi:HSP20 family molecular chaperone IbpA
MESVRDALGDLPDAVFADVLESDDAYLIVVDLPGASAGTVNASVEGGRLSVEARRAKDIPKEFQYLSEERSLFLDLEFPVPRDATGRNAKADIDRGVLELRLPKQSSDAGTTIEIEDR